MASVRTPLRVPDLGGSDEVELLKWHKAAGEAFDEGDELADFVTDKAAFALEAPVAGRLLEVIVAAPAKVRAGDIVAYADIR